MKKIVLFLLCIVLLVPILSGCKSDEVLIKERVDQLLFAFNSGDMEGVLNCYDAKTRNANKALLGLGNKLLGDNMDLSGLFSLVVGFASEGEMLRMEDVQITVNAKGTKATVKAKLYYSDIENEQETLLQLTMVKEDGDWFITP